eukprot:Gb_16155 [translate_table: standard]
MVLFRGGLALSKLFSRLVNQFSTYYGYVRWLQSALEMELRAQLRDLIPERQEHLKKLKSNYGNVSLSDSIVEMVIREMRGIKGMLWDTSLLDLDEGIFFRGLTITECHRDSINGIWWGTIARRHVVASFNWKGSKRETSACIVKGTSKAC